MQKNWKKHPEDQNCWYFHVISALKLRNDKNCQKYGSLNRNFLNFLYRYGIFWMSPGESSCPGGLEYVWQRGIEGVLGWVRGGRSLPYFPKKTTTKMRCHKNRYGRSFQNVGSKMNQRLLIVYEPTLIRFGSEILKIVAVPVFFGHRIYIFFWKIGLTSAARNSA